jgi:hypothetical protein
VWKRAARTRRVDEEVRGYESNNQSVIKYYIKKRRRSSRLRSNQWGAGGLFPSASVFT